MWIAASFMDYFLILTRAEFIHNLARYRVCEANEDKNIFWYQVASS